MLLNILDNIFNLNQNQWYNLKLLLLILVDWVYFGSYQNTNDNNLIVRMKNKLNSETDLENKIHLKLPHLNSKAKIPIKHPKSLSAYNLIDFSLQNIKISPKAPYHKSKRTLKSSILSSKVDFFDAKNEHRLFISRKKTLRDKIYNSQYDKKPEIETERKLKKQISPQLHLLLKKYLLLRETNINQQINYYAVGHFDQKKEKKYFGFPNRKLPLHYQ